MNTGTQFGLMVAELDEDGQEYLAAVHRVDPTYERALQALEAARAALLRRRDRPYRVTEIVDGGFDLLDHEDRSYRRYLVRKL